MPRLAIGLAISFLCCTAAALGVVGAPGARAAAGPSLRFVQVDDLAGVTAMAPRPGTRTLYVTLQRGDVQSLRDGKRGSTPVVDLTERVSQDGGERGLLGLAFSPDGKFLYVDYTDRAGDTQVDQFTMRGRTADPSTRRTIISIDQPQPNHNGGQLAFGPDGYLYIGMGDGGSQGDSGSGHAPGGNGQSLDTLLGKVLRIAPTTVAGGEPYTVPADNPFVGHADARPEIWAYGLRNPWRFSFDAETGDLWIGDVGQNEWEEIDHAPATAGRDAGRGDNFGWNRLEGTHPYRGDAPDDAVAPVYEISHDTGACAVVGGFVYRGTKIDALQGDYVFADNCDGTIRVLSGAGAGAGEGAVTMQETGAEAKFVSSFGEDNAGNLYALSLADGIFRIAAR
jgi:glucose/arabinose dehydrogenase